MLVEVVGMEIDADRGLEERMVDMTEDAWEEAWRSSLHGKQLGFEIGEDSNKSWDILSLDSKESEKVI